jgi:uncharacterized protein (TIGR02246 family)
LELSKTEFRGVRELVDGLTQAWNAGDSLAFAGCFTEDGDLVNIHGMRVRGRSATAGLYAVLFRKSRMEPAISGSRVLCDDALLLRVAVLVPPGFSA